MIFNKSLNEGLYRRFDGISDFFKSKIGVKNFIFVVLSLLLANQGFLNTQSPFSFVLFGVASVFNVPLILVLISSVLSLVIGTVTFSTIAKLFVFFAVFTFITAILNIEGISRKNSVFIKFGMSYILVDSIFNFINGTFFTNIFANASNVIIVSILYFLFVAGIYVMINIGKGFVFSKEETISMIVTIAMCLTVFSNIEIFGYTITNILIIALILIYGWKNGSINACSAGLITGLLLTCMSNATMSFVVALAFSGLVAGVFGRFGKVSVVISFIIGNVIIAYYTSNFSELTMRASEILFASISLLFMPKILEEKIGNLFNKNETLQKAYENMLGSSNDAKNKIDAISKVFGELSEITVENDAKSRLETREVIKKYLVEYIENTCIDCKNRKNCIEDSKLDMVVEYISTKLENNEEIDKSMLIYDCDISQKMVDDIKEIYSGMKIMRILKKREEENSQKLSTRYKEVSKILSNVANNINLKVPEIYDKKHSKLREELKFYGFVVYEDDYKNEKGNIEYTFVTDILTNIDKQKKQIISLASQILEQNVSVKLILNSSKKEKSKIKLVTIPDYEAISSIISMTKTDEDVSGDSYLSMELDDLKMLNVISDGAGSGKEAAKCSQTVINMLEKLLSSGFDESKAIEIINSVIKSKGDENSFSTLDAFIFDLKTSQSLFVKVGAAPTYILSNGMITTVNNINIPLGLVDNTNYLPISKKLDDGDIVVQISDGVISDETDKNNNFLTKYLKGIDIFKTSKQITEDIRRVILKENKNILNDDFTVIVTKIKKVSNNK